MPSSYREPDEREGERIVYFDYAKSLENQKRPIPWKEVARGAALSGVIGFVVAAVGGIGDEPSAVRGLIFFVPCLFLGLGLIPLIRASRALSGDNFVAAKRRQK
jgi:hypothetical protein